MEWTPTTLNGIGVPKWWELLFQRVASDMKITALGIDLPKEVFQVHGVDTQIRYQRWLSLFYLRPFQGTEDFNVLVI